MNYAGIDIGSRTIELVVVNDDGDIQEMKMADTTFSPLAVVEQLMADLTYDTIMATGYGRNLFEISYDSATVTEIKAHARGARHAFPECSTILDIGGQDSKVISLFDNGKVQKFEMNDRCAAGTGKFLEIMSKALGFKLNEFGQMALQADHELNISSMCTVFAESEVTSLIAKGHPPQDIAKGLHASVVRRAISMIRRVSGSGNIVFTGGVAQNPCIIELMEEQLNQKVNIPKSPQYMGALGAALLASEQSTEGRTI